MNENEISKSKPARIIDAVLGRGTAAERTAHLRTGARPAEVPTVIGPDELEYAGEVWVRQSVADNAYSERNRLAGLLAALLRASSHIGRTDEATPDYSVAIVGTPFGQASWHIPDRDLAFFDGIEASGDESSTYDGHTTDEKHARLEAMRRSLLGTLVPDEPIGDRLAAEVVVDVSDLEGGGDLEDLRERIAEAVAAWRPTITVNERRY